MEDEIYEDKENLRLEMQIHVERYINCGGKIVNLGYKPKTVGDVRRENAAKKKWDLSEFKNRRGK